MANVTELRVALTVEDSGRALAFYRDALGLEQLADWSSGTGRVVATIAVMPISARGPVAALFLPVIGLSLPLAALAALGGGRR